MSGLELTISKQLNSEYAFTNCVYINFKTFSDKFCKINNHIFKVINSDEVELNTICLNSFQRIMLNKSVNSTVIVTKSPLFSEIKTATAISVTFKSRQKGKLIIKDVENLVKHILSNHIIYENSTFIFSQDEIAISFSIISIISNTPDNYFKVSSDTIIEVNPSDNIEVIHSKGVKFVNNKIPLNLYDITSENIGVGGLGNHVEEMFRRVFASRTFSPETIKLLGIDHIKGILLYGPSGTGKTALARGLSKVLKSVEPKIINGPEIINKYVGQSEENMRKLFQEAENDYKTNGDNAQLHTIIFDEIDAICKKRSGSDSSSSSVNDNIVNQLLTKMDGFNKLPNILIIGITNRIDILDPALLRAGRFEVQLEIGLPSEIGRLEIFQIHTKKMRENFFIDGQLDLHELAKLTNYYSGAEIEGIVKKATSYAMDRVIKSGENDVDIKINQQDFITSIQNTIISSQKSTKQLKELIDDTTDVNFEMEKYDSLIPEINKWKNRLLTIFINTKNGTQIISRLFHNCDTPVKYICPKEMLCMNDDAKVAHLTNSISEAHTCNKSIVIFDCLEQIIQYSKYGFSNRILQTLLVLSECLPKKNSNSVIVITTNLDSQIVEEFGFKWNLWY